MKLFSSGSELANLLVGSDLLQQSWKRIRDLSNGIPNFQSSLGLKFKLYKQQNRMIVAFVTSPYFAVDQLQHGQGLVPPSSSTAKESFALFESLSGKTHFSINRASITLFDQHRDQLSQLKNEVEEAILSCKLLKNIESSVEEKESSEEKLKKFEDYVLCLLKNYAVSPEIFLKASSFMQWWKDYKEAMGRSYTSPLTLFMDKGQYEKYARGQV